MARPDAKGAPNKNDIRMNQEAKIRIIPGDLGNPIVTELLLTHLATARAATARGSAHALDLTGLKAPGISLWTIWEDGTLLGVGALKEISPVHGEVKSMHTAKAARRKGAASAMLRHIVANAHERGMSRLSLETGSWDYFLPARALYTSHGFTECPPFEGYVADPNSVFMTLDLSQG
jgi:putative acetyltransferase